MKIHPMKRLVALMTALLMVITTIPVAAFADNGTAEGGTGGSSVVVVPRSINEYLTGFAPATGVYAVGDTVSFELKFQDVPASDGIVLSFSFPEGLTPKQASNADIDGQTVNFTGSSASEYTITVDCEILSSISNSTTIGMFGKVENVSLTAVNNLDFDGKQFALVLHGQSSVAVKASAENGSLQESNVKSVSGSYGTTDNTEPLSVWSFIKEEGINRFQIKNGDSFLNISTSGVSLSGNPQTFFIEEGNNGSYKISTLDSDSKRFLGHSDNRFISSADGAELTFVSLQDYTIKVIFGGLENQTFEIKRQKNSPLLPIRDTELSDLSLPETTMITEFKDDLGVLISEERTVSGPMTVYPVTAASWMNGKVGSLVIKSPENCYIALQSTNDYNDYRSVRLDALLLDEDNGSLSSDVTVTTWRFIWIQDDEYYIQEASSPYRYLNPTQSSLTMSSEPALIRVIDIEDGTFGLIVPVEPRKNDNIKYAVNKKKSNKDLHWGFQVYFNNARTKKNIEATEKFRLVNVQQPAAIEDLNGQTGALVVSGTFSNRLTSVALQSAEKDASKRVSLEVLDYDGVVSPKSRNNQISIWKFEKIAGNVYAIKDLETNQYLSVSLGSNKDGLPSRSLTLSSSKCGFSIVQVNGKYYIKYGFYGVVLNNNGVGNGFELTDNPTRTPNAGFILYPEENVSGYRETLIFNANNGTEEKSYVYAVADEEVPIKIPECTATNEGYTFKYWTSKKDGSGTVFLAGDDYYVQEQSGNNSINFYAQWQVAEVTIRLVDKLDKDSEETLVQEIKQAPGTIITLPRYNGTRDDYVYVGWTTHYNLQLHTDDKDENGKTYQASNGSHAKNYLVVYEAGNSFSVPDHDITLYTAWTPEQYGDTHFSIRKDGIMPYEPSHHAVSNYYAHIDKTGIVKVQRWIVDTNDAVTVSLDKNYAENNVSRNLTELPSNEEIKAVYPEFDPETQYIVWYVQKLQTSNDIWHVDGVVRFRDKLTVSYHSNVDNGDVVKNMPNGYQLVKDPDNGNNITVGYYPKNASEWTTSEPVRTNYKFIGWTIGQDGQEIYKTNDVIEGRKTDIDFYAQWKWVGPNKTTIKGKKTWDDNNNELNNRPEKITVVLRRSGSDAVVSELEVTGGEIDDEWEFEFVDVPKYDDKGTIIYTVDELTVPAGYVKTAVYGTEIINSTEFKDIIGVKIWNDEGRYQDRPESVTLELYENGKDVPLESFDLTEANDYYFIEGAHPSSWTHVFQHKPTYRDGVEIGYTVREKDVPTGYILEKTDSSYAVTNTPEKTEATVRKVWDDAGNQDGNRPETLTVKLLANNEDTGRTVTLTAEDGWAQKTITGLNKYSRGALISYTWEEVGLPESYRLTNTSTNDTVTTLTNSYTPETTEATVRKVWNDASNQDGKRPESLTVTLSNGTEVTLNADNSWTATVENLPKYAAGEEIE